MKKKKLLLLTALAFTTLATTAFIGCKKDEETSGTSGTPEIRYEVSLESESVIMTVGDKRVLIADIVQQGDTQLTFTSSDEQVATVDEYGWVTAIKEGTTTITANYGTASDTCKVTVSMNGLSPVLQLPGVPSDSVSMSKSSNLDLNGAVLFNGKTYDDVTLTYAVEDTSVGTIQNGVFVPLKSGTTKIAVSGTWRETTGSTMNKTIIVEIIPEFLFAVNDGMSDITLHTFTDTVSPFEVTAEYDGVALETNVEVTQGADYISYDPNAKTVTSKGLVGEAEITVSYELNNEQMSAKFPVYVKPTMYDYETTVTNFSAIHGDTAIGDSLRTRIGEAIVSATDYDGSALEVKDDKVYGVQSSNDGKFTSTITVYTATRGWNIDIEGYSGIIAKAEDLALFKINLSYTNIEEGGSRVYHAIDETKPIGRWEGYYILANNINASGYDHGSNGEELASRGMQSSIDYGFMGTFDGQGYTISNMRVRSFGLFGYVVNATIKNVAFENVDLYNSDKYKQSSVLASWIKNSTLSDVYISVKNATQITKGGGSVFANGVDASTLTRCIVETKAAFDYKEADLTYTGSFTYMNKERMDGDEIQTDFVDVYVISNEVLGSYRTSKTVDNVKVYYRYWFQAENETLEVAEDDIVLTFEGVKKYSTRADMQSANNNYATFDNAYWTITSGTPVWKSLNS